MRRTEVTLGVTSPPVAPSLKPGPGFLASFQREIRSTSRDGEHQLDHGPRPVAAVLRGVCL